MSLGQSKPLQCQSPHHCAVS